jgi:hypothetical protein
MKTQFTFERIVGLSSLFIASCAAFFSIIGIGMLFSGSAIASMIMASSLEIGKLVATTFLYRYWKRSQLLLKTYLILAVVALMFITSLGIFGYLTSAYQQSAIENKLSEEKIVYIQDQKKMYSDKISDAKKRIENISKLRVSQEERLNESMTNVIISRNPIQLAQIQQSTKEFIDKSEKDIDTENNKIQSTVDEIQKLDKQISDIKIKSGGQKDLQTFKFVADEFGVDINKVVKWFIICLISVFDPLAICLLLAYNTTLGDVIYVKPTVKVEENPKKEPTVEEIVEQAKEEATQEVKEGQIIKEIIKEVPVHIEKEVIKEVPVEKEIIKEVVVDNSYKPNHFSF